TTVAGSGMNLRQLGDQECEIIPCVTPITKYAVSVVDPLQIQYELQKALYIAKTGRSGPVWVDIPMNVQGAYIDETQLPVFNPAIYYPRVPVIASRQVKAVLDRLRT